MILLQDARILVCMGSGGVGKTTLSVAMACMAARQGRRVLLLTIDPSQRLRTLLKLQSSGAVGNIALEAGDKGEPVQFDAAIINHEAVFGEFIAKALDKSPDKASQLMRNKLYQQLVYHLGGSQEFTALQRLYQGASNANYDLVILDTPPSQHAFDFLAAPQKLSSLFREGIAKWFRKSEEQGFMSRILQSGTVRALGLIQSLTGQQFFHELRDFFENVSEWSGKLESRLVEIQRLLSSKDTHFLIVTSHDQVKLEEAAATTRELKRAGHDVSGIVVNRTLPIWFREAPAESWGDLRSKMQSYYSERYRIILKWMQSMGSGASIYSIPEMPKDMESTEDVLEILKFLAEPSKAEELR